MANRANLANSFLAAPISDSDTTLTVEGGDGVLFPATPFWATLTVKNKLSRFTNSEIVEVTDVTSDTLTIVRAQRGTTAQEFDTGDIIANGFYVEDVDDIYSQITSEIASAISAAKSALNPVGSIYMSTSSTNPGTSLGFGTWVAWGQGRVPVGIGSNGTTDYTTVEATGGEERHTLTVAEMPSHTHTQDSHLHSVNPPSTTTSYHGGHSHRQHIDTWMNVTPRDGLVPTGGAFNARAGAGTYNTYSAGAHTHTVDIAAFNSAGTTATNQNTGGDGDHNVMQPYITCYMWKRTA